MSRYVFDDDVQTFIDKCLTAFNDGSAAQSADEQRQRYAALCQSFDYPLPDNILVEDHSVTCGEGTIPMRLYRPIDTQNAGCLVYFHGGGWVVGNLESHNAITAELASRAGVVVIAVDYRLAPEHPYPAAHEDCWTVVEHVLNSATAYHVDPLRIAVGGDSAGAHIAAGMARRARDCKQQSLVAQVLIYGSFGGDSTLPSYSECSDAPLLSTSDMDAYHTMYWPNGMLPGDAMARPLSVESMEGLPSAFIQAAEYDPLRDDSVEYARRLEAAGVPVELHVESGLVHGFLRSRHVTRKGAAAFNRICEGIARLLDQ